MDMRGVTDTYGIPESVKRAVAAGADILLESLDPASSLTGNNIIDEGPPHVLSGTAALYAAIRDRLKRLPP